MNQAIITKSVKRGIKARCRSGSKTTSALSGDIFSRHCRAARLCADKFGWTGYYRGASPPDGKGYCFVWVSHDLPEKDSALSFYIGQQP